MARGEAEWCCATDVDEYNLEAEDAPDKRFFGTLGSILGRTGGDGDQRKVVSDRRSFGTSLVAVCRSLCYSNGCAGRRGTATPGYAFANVGDY